LINPAVDDLRMLNLHSHLFSFLDENF
jgi:hypothetical protein